MKQLTKIQKELEHTTERVFKDSKKPPSVKYKAYLAYLKIGKFHGRSPIAVANDFGAQKTLQILGEVDGTQSFKNRLEGKNPGYAHLILGKKTRLKRGITKPTNIKWVFLCNVLLQIERFRPERH
ncbi:hypothetical protein BCT62_00370 [Vibrio splendidus]|jgi:hypothetical protein|uniref:hypothetical protein n=1 Tax=Vibrio splendidus TaxID=29497 RepID=UPI000C824ACC|nr:hypothetical protein [Vibrio splendidus]PMM19948.1 hypothetical protein BCT62_00370 [Vibrio splendidus]